MLESPKLRGYIDQIRASLATVLGIDAGQVSVKAKTNEGIDAIGRGEAIAAHAIALSEEPDLIRSGLRSLRSHEP